MPLFCFSDEFKQRVRQQINPISVRVLREVADSPELAIEELRCQSCGFVYAYNPPKVTKATAIHDCEWTHEFSWKTGARCGGQFAFVTQPVFTLV
jgi:hypothetical protein